MLYNFYIFNRKGICLYYREWNRPLNTLSGDPKEDYKLMFGMLFELKNSVIERLSPSSTTNSVSDLHTVRTGSFTLHHYQSPTGLVFVLNTDPGCPDLHHHLQHIFANIFVEFVCRNPLYYQKPDEVITCKLFSSKLEEYIMTLPCARNN